MSVHGRIYFTGFARSRTSFVLVDFSWPDDIGGGREFERSSRRGAATASSISARTSPRPRARVSVEGTAGEDATVEAVANAVKGAPCDAEVRAVGAHGRPVKDVLCHRRTGFGAVGGGSWS